MLYKITLTHFVCAAIVLNVVHSAPSQTNRETLPHRHEDRLLATNLPASSLSHSNDPERTVHNGDASHDNQQNGSSRMKRAIIFRPLFVYRQQEIKKQKLNEMRQQQQQQIQQQQQNVASAACAACQHYQQSTRQPVRYYAQQYPYQRW
ncbi:probable serine/threonine-protein kinase cdc7 [Anopheles marshallii]|uniref:probable serine/threonine-protein kinase cdc7 n=1 Tax=Anopheles marshallii TaxID=1521116 RepID=UPI00237C2EBC|nr:probable serine/threonine-protein kinase cdc7 [Anopheles marshallii]